MKLLLIGSISKEFQKNENFTLVDKPEDADYVIIDDGIKSYFLGTILGEILEKAYSLEFSNGSPKVMTFSQYIKEFTTNEVSL